MDVSESRSVSKVDVTWFISQWRRDQAVWIWFQLNWLNSLVRRIQLDEFFPTKDVFFFSPKYNYKASFTETNVAFFSVKIVFNVILLASKHSGLSKLERSPDLTWKAPKGVVVVTIWESLAGQKERRWKDREAAKSLFHHAPLPPTSFRHLPSNSQGNKRILHTALVFLYPKLTEALGLKAEEKKEKNCFSHSS